MATNGLEGENCCPRPVLSVVDDAEKMLPVRSVLRYVFATPSLTLRYVFATPLQNAVNQVETKEFKKIAKE